MGACVTLSVPSRGRMRKGVKHLPQSSGMSEGQRRRSGTRGRQGLAGIHPLEPGAPWHPFSAQEASGFLTALFSSSGHLAHIASHKSEAIFRTSLQVAMGSRQSQKEGKTRVGVGEGLPGTLAAGSWVRLATSQGSALYAKTSEGYGYHSKLCLSFPCKQTLGTGYLSWLSVLCLTWVFDQLWSKLYLLLFIAYRLRVKLVPTKWIPRTERRKQAMFFFFFLNYYYSPKPQR